MTNITDENLFPPAQPENQQDLDWLKAGVYNVVISKVELVKDAQGNVVSNGTKYSHAIDIEYTHENSNGKKQTHTERYYMGGKGQFHFDLMAKAAGIDNKEKSAGKSSALGQRLWIAIRKDYETNPDGTIVRTEKGYLKGYYRIFEHSALTDANNPPVYEGSSEETKDQPTTGKFAKLLPPKGGTTANAGAAPVAQTSAPPPPAPEQESVEPPADWT